MTDNSATTAEFGSDVIVELLQQLGVEHLAINPGASPLGLQDSLVDHAHDAPHLIICLHEEHAVAIAHGYAEASRPMAVAVHTNVRLMHASTAISTPAGDSTAQTVLPPREQGDHDASH